MSAHPSRDRLLELLVDERMGMLSPDDAPELDRLLQEVDSTPELERALGELLVALDAAEGGPDMPDEVRNRIIHRGQVWMTPGREVGTPTGNPRGRIGWIAAIAATLLLLAALGVSSWLIAGGRRDLHEAQARLAEMREQIGENEQVLANARRSADELRSQLDQRQADLSDAQAQLADAAEREVELGRQLASATDNLEQARLEIARYETPADPAELAQNRRKLLDMPDTVRIAWAPFDLPGDKAEQRDVTGDVVWNDDLQSGYLRFVGLDVNDPRREQYQVWIIDDRGMEQKVSGGVFNATADGEVIVPIHPGIDVRRVALFAVTVEDPGGTWVPDLKRRVVVAPRDG